ncbi:hypothetical protein HBB16_00035 [Pseudonocardia sp. MCCB 268]|nr:hypothetical protein [Pseudonocardia cytotoxica]
MTSSLTRRSLRGRDGRRTPGASALLPTGCAWTTATRRCAPRSGRVYSTDQVRSEADPARRDERPRRRRAVEQAADRFLEQLRDEAWSSARRQAAAVRGILTSSARIGRHSSARQDEEVVRPSAPWPAAGPTASHTDDSAAGGRVFRLATSQVATDVLAGEDLTARNVTRWLRHPGAACRRGIEHRTVDGTRRSGCRAGDGSSSTSPR